MSPVDLVREAVQGKLTDEEILKEIEGHGATPLEAKLYLVRLKMVRLRLYENRMLQ